MGFLTGKRILVTGLASNRSIAYGIAKAMKEALSVSPDCMISTLTTSIQSSFLILVFVYRITISTPP